jgi:NAD(P)H-dependent flavin oxidoreductase YrpB (nitropropane dioxygenase family)
MGFIRMLLVPTSASGSQLIVRKWQKTYHRLPDAVVVEDPDTAGGHLGEKMEKIGTGEYDQYATVREIKAFFRDECGADVPVIAAGGVWDRADLEHALAEGADGVQMANRLSALEECDAVMSSSSAISICKKISV